MKTKITNTLSALAVLGGLALTATCNGLAIFLLGFALVYAGALALIKNNTDYVTRY